MSKLFLFITLLLFSINCLSFTLNSSTGDHFTDPNVTVDISNNSCTNAGMTSDELLTMAMQAAELYWNSIPTCKLNLKKGSIVNVDISTQTGVAADFNVVTDNHILVGCNADTTKLFKGGSDKTTLALGALYNNKGIVYINNTPNTPIPSTSEAQKVATVAHEMGHAFGLGHSQKEYALMYYQLGLIQERLSYDDMDGCHYLYNRSGAVNCASVDIDSKGSGPGSRNNFIALLIGFFGLIISCKYITKRIG